MTFDDDLIVELEEESPATGIESPTSRREKIVVDKKESGLRLDLFLVVKLSDLSRSFIQHLILNGYVLVNHDQCIKPSRRVKSRESILVTIPPPQDLNVEPENIPLEIIYEDPHLIVINKEAGIVMHPSAGNMHGTLVNALLYHIKDLSDIAGITRPGIVHRLDKETSGVLVIAKDNKTHQSLTMQLKARRVKKTYLAIAAGMISIEGELIDLPIGRDERDRKKMAINYKDGRYAITDYKVLERFEDYSYLEVYPETGRTHQIRVHLAYIKHPIFGDKLYGKSLRRFTRINPELNEVLKRHALHAYKLEFIHPVSERTITFEAKIPEDFQNALKVLRRESTLLHPSLQTIHSEYYKAG